jgi:LDH2 family malate/lactate/ureidoglycolate dehydrogenase
VQPDEARRRIAALGFSAGDTELLVEHFSEAEERGKLGHGFSRVEWLEGLDGFDPTAAPVLEVDAPGFRRYRAADVIGYLALRHVVERELADPPENARVIVAAQCFPTGMLGHYVRKLARAGLVGIATATSPARLPHPAGGVPLAGTNPLAIAIPSGDGRPLVADVSMGRVTYGDVLRGAAAPEDLVPFGGEHAHKAFALAIGLQLVVDAVAAGGYGAFMVVARPVADPVPGLRERAGELRLPGDR